MKFAKGRPGDWFATVTKTGEQLPCLDRLFWTGKGYDEPFFYDPSIPKHAKHLEAVKRGRVLFEIKKGGSTRRDTYLEHIYTVEDVSHDQSGLRLRVTKKETP
jgi:hypothetical protein